jgi:hypothetical protein
MLFKRHLYAINSHYTNGNSAKVDELMKTKEFRDVLEYLHEKKIQD